MKVGFIDLYENGFWEVLLLSMKANYRNSAQIVESKRRL